MSRYFSESEQRDFLHGLPPCDDPCRHCYEVGYQDPEETAIFGDTYHFMRIGGQLAEDKTGWLTADHKLRIDLLSEEFNEYLDKGEKLGDPVETADGLADIIVVAMGTLIAYFGRDKALAILAEVGASNLSKFVDDGAGNLVPVLKDNGKIAKGPNFKAPDIAAILEG